MVKLFQDNHLSFYKFFFLIISFGFNFLHYSIQNQINHYYIEILFPLQANKINC